MTRRRFNSATVAYLAGHLFLSLAPPRHYPIGPVLRITSDDLRTTYMPEDRIEIVVRTYRFNDGSEVTIERLYPVLKGWPYPDGSDWRALQAWDDWEAGRKATRLREDMDVREEAIRTAKLRPGKQTWIRVGQGRGPMAGRQGR